MSSGLKSNVLPWIAAGWPGKVDTVWVGSANASSPMDVTGSWSVYMAQSLNATSATPTFAQTLVSTQPMRLGWVCTQGILCTEAGDDGRILLDFISVAVDSNGMANIAYGDAGPDSEGYNRSQAPTRTRTTPGRRRVRRSTEVCARAAAPPSLTSYLV